MMDDVIEVIEEGPARRLGARAGVWSGAALRPARASLRGRGDEAAG